LKHISELILFCSLLTLLFILYNCTDILNVSELDSRGGFCITFDDDYIENWYGINDLLLNNEINATFFISNIDSLTNYEIDLLKELKASGHEIGSHGMHHTNAIEYLMNHSLEEYYNYEIKSAIDFMDTHGMKPTSFAYPYGRSSDSLDYFLLKHFKILRHVTIEQLQPPTKEIDQIDEIYYRFNGKRFVAGLGVDVNYNISIDDIKKILARSKNEKTAVIFFAHRPVDSSPMAYEISRNYLDSLFIIANALKLRSYKFSDLLTLTKD
jgi:peptidoglycan-N-acetylglucosamine deacetylase